MDVGKLALIVVSMFSTGCASWRTSEHEWHAPLAELPAPSTQVELGVRLAVWYDENESPSMGWNEALPDGGTRFGRGLRDELQQSRWFSKVEPRLDAGTVHADLRLARGQHGTSRLGGNPLLYLPVLTLSLLPGFLTIHWSLEARFTDAAGRMTLYEVADEQFVLVWIGAVLLMPFGAQHGVEERIASDLYRRVFDSARIDGVFGVVGPAGE